MALGPHQRGKGGGHNHGRQDKGNRSQGPEQRLAAKVIAGEHISRRHASQQRQQGGEESLARRERQQARVVWIGEQHLEW